MNEHGSAQRSSDLKQEVLGGGGGLTIEKQLQHLQMEVFVHFVSFQASLCLFAWGPQ